MPKKLFLILGAPGSGKTTNAEIIAKQNSEISHYSTGDMLRAEVLNKSQIGKQIEKFISNGLIVPIEIAIKTITNAIQSAPTNTIILDGYPRSIEQMEALEDFLKQDNFINLISVIEVKVSIETAKLRVIGRSRGEDDKIKVFNNRMEVYTKPLAKIKSFYKNKNILQTISGEKSIEEVVLEIETFIKTTTK